MAKDNAYYPSLKPGKRYFQYLRYLIEYARHKDWKSIVSSLRFVATGQPERERRIVSSRLGRFVIRKGTTDFQFINYAYEHKIRDYLANNLDHFDLFLDVGACIGEYCVWLASMGKQVVAFEPVPANYIALKENASLNNAVDVIEALPFGLGAKEEEVHFEIMNVVTGSSHIDRDQTNGAGNISIKRLDDILLSEKIDDQRVVMKLDVEGMELEVLEGGQEFIRKCSKIDVIFEHTFSGKDEVQNFLSEIREFSYQYLDEYNILASSV